MDRHPYSPEIAHRRDTLSVGDPVIDHEHGGLDTTRPGRGRLRYRRLQRRQVQRDTELTDADA